MMGIGRPKVSECDQWSEEKQICEYPLNIRYLLPKTVGAGSRCQCRCRETEGVGGMGTMVESISTFWFGRVRPDITGLGFVFSDSDSE